MTRGQTKRINAQAERLGPLANRRRVNWRLSKRAALRLARECRNETGGIGHLYRFLIAPGNSQDHWTVWEIPRAKAVRA
jgi:hypothetical protein